MTRLRYFNNEMYSVRCLNFLAAACQIALKLVWQGITDGSADAADSVAETSAAKAEGVETPTESAKVGGDKQNDVTPNEAEIVQMDPQPDHKRSTEQHTNSKDATGAEKIEESEVTKAIEKVQVDTSNVGDFVGKPVFHAERIYNQTPVGFVVGLVWTAMGGSTLYIETTQVEQGDGRGALNLTGQLGEVMKESAQIAHTVARAILLEKEPDNLFFANTKLHLHVPAGATPKDGPIAGRTMITSLLSLAMKKPVRKDLAMTGEVTLTGKTLPVGGVKEKTIAARRGEVKTIIFPWQTGRILMSFHLMLKEGLDVHFVDDYSQIFELAFGCDQNEKN